MLTGTILFYCLRLYHAAGLRRLFFISGFQQLRNEGQALWRSIRSGNVITMNTEKDDTDTFAAARKGIKRGYRIFHIYCGTGGRLEHTVANMQLLAYLAQSNRKGFLFDQDRIITAITNSSMKFHQHPTGYVSVFSHSENSTGVFLKGLKYELDNATLTNTSPIGVSNEFIGKESIITVETGTLLIVFPREIKTNY